MELKETSELMTSPDYKERFKAEYIQLKIRIEGLSKMLEKYKSGTLEFKPTCSFELLNRQLEYMKYYAICLETRAPLENIKL